VFLGSLHVFGEIAVVHDAQKLHSKLANQGEHCLFVSYANDHTGDTFKMLNLKTQCFWKSRDVKWIAKSIIALEEPKLMTSLSNADDDDDNEDVHAWAQAHGINLILDNDNANAAAPPAVLDDKEDNDATNEDDDNGTAIVQPMPTTQTKMLCAMQQLTTFYNPVATNYIYDAASDDDTITTSNQLGREGAEATDPDPDDNDSDTSLKRHVLQEDVLPDQASAAIDYLLNFAFYSCNQVLAPPSESEQLDFQNAFEHHMIEPTMFQEAYNHEDPEQCAKWHATIHKEFKDMNNHGVWCKVKRLTIPQGH